MIALALLSVKRPLRHLIAILCSLVVLPAFATVQLPAFFSNGMVLQQRSTPAIWGWTTTKGKVTITTSWNKKQYTAIPDASGKWKMNIATPVAGGPYSISISDGKALTISDILIGEVWLCSGQSNMEMPMKGFKDQPVLHSNEDVFNSANSQLRLYIVPRSVQRSLLDTTKNSSWKEAAPEAVANFSATAYYFGRLLQQRLGVPVGLMNISYGGSPVEAFMDDASLKAFPDISLKALADTAAKLNNRVPEVLYNGMLGPFLGYGVRGCLWYQGETNYDRPAQYEKLLPAFVQMVRQQSANDSMPFYYVQIAPYDNSRYAAVGSTTYNSAYLRDAQRKALKIIPNSGMVVLMDAGEEQSIHPADKEIVGKRLAYMALAQTYSQQGFGYISPLFDAMTITGNTATLTFKNAPNGLTAFSKPLDGFEVAGADKRFRPARAIISGGKVLVSSPEVAAPVAVRYAFTDYAKGSLFSTEGLPASSFRTDDW